MKKLIAIALLAIASSFAAASDLTLAYLNKPNAEVANVSASAPEATANAPAPTAFVKGAGKVGAFLGGLMKGPTMMGKAFVSGFGNGYQAKGSTESKGETTAAAPATEDAEAQAPAHSKVASRLAKLSPTAIVAGLFKRPKDQQNAPVEEKSTLASNTDY